MKIGFPGLKYMLVFFTYSFLAAACSESSNTPDAASDADGQAQHDGDAGEIDGGDGGDPGLDGADGSGSDDGGDGAGGDCPHTGKLGEDCTDDCGCAVDLACRGLPGEQVCSYGCVLYNDCDGKPVGCDSPYCDQNLGVCRCFCQPEDCPGQQCYNGYCVGCGNDTHCEELTCTADPDLDQPRCRPDTETCVCAGECGDTRCDPYEEAIGSCPEECAGSCQDGQVLSFSCKNMQTVEWCVCEQETWDCSDPLEKCTGENDCDRMGGQCSPTVEDCYEGEVAAEPYGCMDPSPLCCMPLQCTGPGMSYYPYLGLCCPGLRAIPSRAPMEGMFGPGLVACCDSCWALICAPCDDGVCQFHLGENWCTCPEDCPHPPIEFYCEQAPECGEAHCGEDGTRCIQLTPACRDNRCDWSTQEFEDQICNPVTRTCQTPG